MPKLRRWPAMVMGASVVCAALAYAWLGSSIQPRLSATSAAVPAVASSESPPVAAPDPSAEVQPVDAAVAAASAEPAAQPTARGPIVARNDAVVRRLGARREPATVRRTTPAVSDTDHAGGDGRAATVDPVAASQPASLQALATSSSQGDRWQALNQALASCDGNFIERVVCGQRARFRYCDGYWGRVPQCPSGAVADNR